MRSFAALSLATAALAFPSNIEERNLFPHPSIPNVAYMLDNDPNGCNIISFHIFQNGSIGEPLRTPTGGLGAMSYCRGLGCGNQGDLFPVDDLGSQGAVKVSGNMLFTVNAGSSELSLFEINPFDPYRPKHIHNIDTMGDFPMSVDYSPKLRQACVLNGGTRAGISCFTVDLLLGMRPSGPLRKLEKSLYNQTKYASGDFNTTGQILFNPDSTGVFATIKGNGFFPPYTPGSLVAWPIKNGKVSTGPYVLNQFDDIHMDFGFLFIKKDRVMITDPSSGVVFMDISPDLKASIFVHTIIAGNLLSCWTAWSPSLNTLYSMDGAKNNIYLLNPQTGAHFANITVKPEVPANYSGATEGTYDAIIAQNGILYTLAYTNGMFAVDTKTRKQTQYYDLSFMGDRTHWQGLAQWPEQKLPV